MYSLITKHPSLTSRYVITISAAKGFYIMRSGLPVYFLSGVAKPLYTHRQATHYLCELPVPCVLLLSWRL